MSKVDLMDVLVSVLVCIPHVSNIVLFTLNAFNLSRHGGHLSRHGALDIHGVYAHNMLIPCGFGVNNTEVLSR